MGCQDEDAGRRHHQAWPPHLLLLGWQQGGSQAARQQGGQRRQLLPLSADAGVPHQVVLHLRVHPLQLACATTTKPPHEWIGTLKGAWYHRVHMKRTHWDLIQAIAAGWYPWVGQ